MTHCSPYARLVVVWALLSTALSTSLSHADTQVRVSSYEYGTGVGAGGNGVALGLLSKEVIEPDQAAYRLESSYSYDSYGNKISINTGARTNTSNYAAQPSIVIGSATYSTPAGVFPTTSANAVNHTETKTYDPRFGAMLQLTGPNGLKTNWDYDNFGRKTKETRADGTYTTWTYQYCTPSSMAGAIACPSLTLSSHIAAYAITQTERDKNGNPLSAAKLQYLDALGRELRSQSTDYSGNTVVVDTQYNNLGQVSAKSQPYILGGTPLWSNYAYDSLGRVLTADAPDSTVVGGAKVGYAVTTYSYEGLTTRVTVASGTTQAQTKTTVKNSQGQVASVTDAAGSITTYAYDAQSQLIQTNAAGSITSLSYNVRGQKTGMVDPSMGIWTYSYNAFGELLTQTDSLGQTSTMVYDDLGRMKQRTENDLISNWYYDKKADGNVCGMSKGKLCQATSSNGYSRIHNYDDKGRAIAPAPC